MKQRYFAILLLVVVLGALTAFCILDIQPMEFPANFKKAGLAADGHDIPAYLSIPAAIISIALINIGLAYLFPRRVRWMEDHLPRKAGEWLQLALPGLAGSVAAAGLLFLSAAGGITFPYVFLLAGVLLLINAFGGTPILHRAGHFLLGQAGFKITNPAIEILMGSVLMVALITIPLAGMLVLLIFSSLSLGLAISSHFGSGQAWSLHPLIQEEKE